MKIILTQNEAIAKLQDSFPGADVSIETASTGVNGLAITDFLRGKLHDHLKIANIKRLRELIPGLGLGDAKYMVEAFMSQGPKSY